MLVARSHGKLVAVELAQRYRARRLKARDDGCIVGADVIPEHAAACGAAPALRDEHILVRDGDAGQWAGSARFDHCICMAGLCQSEVFIDMDERVEIVARVRGGE